MRTFHSFIQSSKARYLLLAAGMALTSPMMAGCPVHPKAHHSLAQPLHAYGKLLGNNTIGSWHPTVYWGISEPDSGSGLRNLDEWLANCDAAMPTFHPVLDPDVQITAGFVEPSLENGPQTHSGIDYARPDGRSFRVFTIAEGRVIFKGYHPSTGNVVIVEHSPIDGVPFRSIYQHLRDGRDHDVELALRTSDFIDQDPSWNWDVYARNYVERATRARDMIKGSDIDRSWMDRFWGTNEQTIGVQEGDYVMSGQAIGWAGCTGIHSHGNQLHFGVARQANFVDAGWEEEHPLPGITRWVFFDPYGLYGGPNDLAAYNRDDGMRGPRQHASIFAPTPEDVAGLDLDEFERAVHYYER
ncbi:MAG: M23 family metallopeptidase, partial [Chlamydiia bacterium]|nr:M23 family metallopeptidase [Chlamydiia bacterium]